MPTGRCNYPHHHGPATGPPISLLAAIALGAIVIGAWHTVVVALVVVAILAGIAGAVFLLIHTAHSQPYDAPERGHERPAVTYTAEVLRPVTDARTAALEAENAALRRQLEAPAVHNHLHLHGIDADDMAVITRKALQPPDYK
jgi:hypothetical protein